MKISVVIPNFNGRKLLEKNLPVVVRESKDAEIIVVDDASEDDSVSFIKSHFPGVVLIGKKKNSGYSSTVNAGVAKAKGDLIVLLNSDAYPKKNYLYSIIPHFEDPELFAVGMLHENIEDGNTVTRGRGMGKFEKGFMMHSRGETDRKDTFWVNGGAGIFRRSIWEKLGGMREIYDPFYWEDIDLSWRAKEAGYKIMFEPASRVVHIQSKGAIRTKYSKSRIKLIAYRNQFLFVWLNLRKPYYMISHLFWLPYHFIKIREKEFIIGFLWALKRIVTFGGVFSFLR